MTNDEVHAFTDGACLGNPGPGGWAALLRWRGREKLLAGGEAATTNNRMEMMAAIVALRELQSCGKKIVLSSDSSYLVNGITKGWAKKWQKKGWLKSDGQAVLNVDLWRELLTLIEGVEVAFNWVKGHAGNELNERCDQLATTAARQAGMVADVVYEESMASGV